MTTEIATSNPKDLQANAHISRRLKPWMLVYGILASFFAFGTIINSIYHVATGDYIRSISLIAWALYLTLFWLAFAERPIGGHKRLWQLFVPLIVALDILGIAVVSKGNLLAIIGSIIFSVPLYIAVYWYGYVFLPAIRSRNTVSS